MLSAFVNSFKVEDLRRRLLFTFGLVFVCRILSVVPTPGVNAAELQRLVQEISSQVGGGLIGLVDLFSGGAMSNCAVGALGIMPYISASIILQLMTAIVPALERLAREGDAGRQKITQYTRYLTLALCLVQGYAMALALQNPSALFGREMAPIVEMGSVWGFRLLTVVTMTTGTMVIMWLGEQITQGGVGNGISLIITVNIISRLPGAVETTMRMFRPIGGGEPQFTAFHLVGMVVMMFLVVAGTIAVTQAQRRIPVQYAKRVVGRKVYGGQSTYMPLRINYSGVMPIIFASAILMFPQKILEMLPGDFFKHMAVHFRMDRPLYLVLYGLMILFFSYFWVATVFNPVQIADDLKKSGGYIPGIRPGTPTAEFLDRTMTRITLAGAIFLTVIAVLPTMMARQFDIPWIVASFFGGTSILIIVGVMLDTMRQIESHLVMRHYDGFLKKGKLRGRR
ncbi:MAG: preprotein translocase subunit SecY [Kiritimatiellia bacterium]|nr:preprotein translocase subunit SecY [Lentisphaerota bacterium]